MRQLRFFLALLLIGALGYWLRNYILDHKLLTCETNNYMFGLRAHNTEWITSKGELYINNFFHFFFTTIAGIRFILSVYISSQIFTWLGIPLDEIGIVYPYVILSTVCIFVTYLLGALLGSRWIGLFAAFLFAINHGVVYSSRWDNAEPTVTFFLLISVYLLFRSTLKPARWVDITLSLCLAITASMESIMGLPFIVAIQFFLTPNEALKLRLRRFFLSPSTYYVWIPTAITLLIHLYYYKKPYGIGLFGYMTSGYGQRLTLATLLPRIEFVYLHYTKYYFGLPFFTLSLVLAAFFLRKNLSKYFGFIFAYFFISFIYLTGTLVRAEHLYICDPFNMLFLASGWVYLFEKLGQKSVPIKLFSRVALVAAGSLFFGLYIEKEINLALARTHMVHPLKAVAYYTRTHGNDDSTIFHLFRCSWAICLHQPSELYYGKQFLHTQDPREPRQLFCSGEASIEEILNSYGLKKASFYVDLKRIPLVDRKGNAVSDFDHPEMFIEPKNPERMKEIGAKKVCTIKFKDIVLAEIYSFENLPYTVLDVEEGNRLWGKEYGRLGKVIPQNRHWIGLVSILNTRFNMETGKSP